jgi:glutamate synthase domain-containing protein 3
VLLEQHLRHTGSTRAATLLERWEESAPLFWRIVPRTQAAAANASAAHAEVTSAAS